MRTNEGKKPVEELISFLRSTSPVGKLSIGSELTKAAEYHTADIGPKGETSHSSSDGTSWSDRLKSFGVHGAMAENIAFGPECGDSKALEALL